MSVTLSNACEIIKMCKQHYTYSMGIQIDWGLHELLKATGLRSLATNGLKEVVALPKIYKSMDYKAETLLRDFILLKGLIPLQGTGGHFHR